MELDAGLVWTNGQVQKLVETQKQGLLTGHPRTQPVQRVNFTHKRALAYPADRGVARQLPDSLQLLREEHSVRPSACCTGCCLASCVAPTNDTYYESGPSESWEWKVHWDTPS